MAVTAKHVVEELVSHDPAFMASKPTNYRYWVVQIIRDKDQHDYVVWTIEYITTSPHSDIAIIWLTALNDVAARYSGWKAISATLEPPPIGTEVVAFGLHNVSFDGSDFDDQGNPSINIKFQRSTSTGIVKQHYWERRDSGMYNFPCMEVDAQFEHGMSGGLVINNNSEACGIVCGSLPPASPDQDHVSYVTMLWPMMAIPVPPERVPKVPGWEDPVHCRLHDLSARGVFTPTGWPQVLIHERPEAEGGIFAPTELSKVTIREQPGTDDACAVQYLESELR